MRFQSIIAALIFAALASRTQAGVVLDQASIPESGIAGGLLSGTTIAGSVPSGQSFTVGTAGRLSRVDLMIFDPVYSELNGSFTFWIEDSLGATVFSTHIDFADVPESVPYGSSYADLLSIDVSSAGLQVVAGQLYRMLVSPDAGSHPIAPAWFYMVGDGYFAYDGGNAFNRTIYGDAPLRIDYGFRTYVDDSAVPEPATWALMIAGFVSVGVALRQRRVGAA